MVTADLCPPFVWMFIKTSEKRREFIHPRSRSITTLIQMEYSAFEEATVPICSFVLQNKKSDEAGLYFRLSDFKGGMEVQRKKVLEAIANPDCGYFYEAQQSNFSKIPGSPVAYWVSNKIINIFNFCPSLEKVAQTFRGLQPGNVDFVREWFEVSCQDISWCGEPRFTWFLMSSGGEFRKWYGNMYRTVIWADDGLKIKSSGNAIIPNENLYFKKVIGWMPNK